MRSLNMLLFYLGFIPATALTKLIGKIPPFKEEFDTGNDSSCIVFGILSIFFGIVILAVIVVLMGAGITTLL